MDLKITRKGCVRDGSRDANPENGPISLSLALAWAISRFRKLTSNSDKSQRATTEQVLDPRTLLILQKMLQRQLLKEIHGCISTGKEANVYHAITDSGDHRAIKGTVQK